MQAASPGASTTQKLASGKASKIHDIYEYMYIYSIEWSDGYRRSENITMPFAVVPERRVPPPVYYR